VAALVGFLVIARYMTDWSVIVKSRYRHARQTN
jgi:hypothetical protein